MSFIAHDPSLLQKWKQEYGMELLSWVPLSRPISFSFYSKWLEEQRHGEMTYLEQQKTLKEDPHQVFQQGKSILVAGFRYKPHPEPGPSPEKLRTAAYAKGADYHNWIAERLGRLCNSIQEQYPPFDYLIATDSKPFLERDLAYQAGLGWFGKNTCLIHPEEGSFFFIAEVLTNLEVQNGVEPLPDFCGTCRRCLDACPTQALQEGRVLDATKCISYWTIEAKTIPPPELRKSIRDWFFGCDICQDVCPWNEKVFRKRPLPESERTGSLVEELRFFLTASNKEIEKVWGESPLIRARPRGLRRNALIVAGNLKVKELTEEIKKWSENDNLGELAQWALRQFD